METILKKLLFSKQTEARLLFFFLSIIDYNIY
jgi:hypothetical protein